MQISIIVQEPKTQCKMITKHMFRILKASYILINVMFSVCVTRISLTVVSLQINCNFTSSCHFAINQGKPTA